MAQEKLSSKAKKAIIGVFVFIFLFTVVLFVYIDKAIDQRIEADQNNTFSLSEPVKNLIRTGNTKDWESIPAVNKPVAFRKYIYLQSGYTSSGNENLTYWCDTEMNKDLGTLSNIPESDVDGLVLSNFCFDTVGYYKVGAVLDLIPRLSSDDDKVSTRKKAIKICKVLTYVSVPEGIVLKRDSVWGKEPPRRINATDNAGMGAQPDNDDIVASIKKTIK